MAPKLRVKKTILMFLSMPHLRFLIVHKKSLLADLGIRMKRQKIFLVDLTKTKTLKNI
jgi:hypothetical protein